MLDCVQRVAGASFPPPWYPRTYRIPEDRYRFYNYSHRHPDVRWIYKPRAGAQGKGIHLVMNRNDLVQHSGTQGIVQEVWHVDGVIR